MNALLTSAGLTTDDLLDCYLTHSPRRGSARIAFIPTAAWPLAGDKDWLLSNLAQLRQVSASLDVVEPALLDQREWLPRLQAADVIAVGGGDATYLLAQLNRAGVAGRINELVLDRMYVGISAGSIVAGPDMGWLYDVYGRPVDGNITAGLDIARLAVMPHRQAASSWIRPFSEVASSLPYPAFEIGDESAVLATEGSAALVGDGGIRVN